MAKRPKKREPLSITLVGASRLGVGLCMAWRHAGVHIERAFLYPTLGVLWVAECEDEEITQAYLRAYNRWIVDFCADSGGRLVPVAQISLGDPEAAEAELRRAARDGVRGIWTPPFTWTRKPLGHFDHHRVFAAAEELGLPVGVHPTFDIGAVSR